jgi:transposase-like protein
MGRSYTEEEKQLGLMALVLSSGNARKASRMCGVARSTLRDWQTKHADDLDALRREQLPKIYELRG